MLTLQALSSSLNAGTAKRGCGLKGFWPKSFGWPPAVCPPKRPRPFAHYRLQNPKPRKIQRNKKVTQSDFRGPGPLSYFGRDPQSHFESLFVKNLLMPLFLRKGCFPVDFQEVKRPLRTKSVKRPIKVGKRPINEWKRPIKAKVLVGISVACLMGCFRAPPPWQKTAPLKRPIKRSMILVSFRNFIYLFFFGACRSTSESQGKIATKINKQKDLKGY